MNCKANASTSNRLTLCSKAITSFQEASYTFSQEPLQWQDKMPPLWNNLQEKNHPSSLEGMPVCELAVELNGRITKMAN